MRDIFARTALATLVFTAAGSAASIAGERVVLRLSMEGCVRTALRNSEEVASAELDVEVARGQVEEARSAAFPQVEASAGYTRQSGLGGAFGDIEEFLGFDTQNYYTATLMLNQVIYQAEVRYGLKAARLAVDRAKTSKRLVHVAVVYGVRAAYAAVLLQDAFAGAAAESVGLARKHLADVRAKRRVGKVTDFEVLQARVQLRNIQAFEIKARSAVRLARTKLLRVLGLDQGLEIELTDTLTYEPEEPEEVPPLDELFAAAVGTRGGGPGSKVREPAARVELQVMDLAIRLQRISLSVASAGRRPSVFLQAGYSGAGFEDWFHEDFSFDWQVGLMVKVPVFDGFRSRGKEMQALAELEQLRLKRRSFVRDTEYEIRSCLLRVETAREAVESQTETVGQAEEAVRQALVRYENGFVTELVVEQARLGLAQARTNLAQAEFDHFMAMLDIRKAAGVLEVPPPAADGTPAVPSAATLRSGPLRSTSR